MKVIIAGGRLGPDKQVYGLPLDTIYALIDKRMKALPFTATEIREGEAPGTDLLARCWARDHGIPCKRYPADWKTHGKPAGPLRNRQMAEGKGDDGRADALVAIWDGKSRGTEDMINTARSMGLQVFIEPVEGHYVDDLRRPAREIVYS